MRIETGHLVSLDRIVSVEAGKRATAIRNVPNTLDIFDSHFPRFPVLPGVLILGSLGRLAEMMLHDETGEVWRTSGAEGIRYRRYVQPGDQMELTVELLERTEDAAAFKGMVRVDHKPVTTVQKLHVSVSRRSPGAERA